VGRCTQRRDCLRQRPAHTGAARTALTAGELACPGRAAAGGCGWTGQSARDYRRSHVLLPDGYMPRRGCDVHVIGAALLEAAEGAGGPAATVGRAGKHRPRLADQRTDPSDRNGTFEPRIVPKHSRRLGNVNDMILSLDEVYPIVYVDGLRLKIKDNGLVVSKTAYLVIGVDVEGRRQAPGCWIADSDGASAITLSWLGNRLCPSAGPKLPPVAQRGSGARSIRQRSPRGQSCSSR
jgi:hypothetical protein